ncbi:MULTISPECIES: toll/interleukin-1 receptor domain-containing protein [unclassified Streptomyces]|uniref:toll/interleukin-1 receptor domain-containing protein n=1 Tax=unclassified Streptomyces TaxID=2593676 RepID=UPI002E156ABA|nr:toll/interleukin-1 receptor domain-containing protein [Streptomyces sp. NBC_01207]WTA17794.1 toll/interleukin-1 receptor domain-containing protein [Streptomyces sp. NBC_00853]
MAPYVFINFRRADTGATGPHIDTALRAEFGTQAAFRDQRSLPAGRDYREQLERGIRKCDLLLVVMGAHWASVRDDAGRRCIDREEDWVRKEIALALAYKLPVMPVLVDGAKLPSIHELPDDIQSLVHQQVVYFRPHQEHIDFPPLFGAIRAEVPELRPVRRSREDGGAGADGGTTFTIDRMSGVNAIFGGRQNTINDHRGNAAAPAPDPEDDDQERP